MSLKYVKLSANLIVFICKKNGESEYLAVWHKKLLIANIVRNLEIDNLFSQLR